MLDHLDDIESDMSAIHGIDDIHTMPARRFFSWVARLPAYAGVMQVRAHEAAEEREPDRGDRYGGKSGQAKEVPAELAAMHAGFAGDGRGFPPAVEIGKGGGGGA